MESLENVIWIFVGAGVILVSTAALGGGIEVKEIKIPKLNLRVRCLAGILGVVFIVFPVVLQELVSKPRVKTFRATPPRIKAGESSRIDWSVSGALAVDIQPEIGNVSLSGPATVSPSETTTYTLRARNNAGQEVVRSITVQVELLQMAGDVQQEIAERAAILSAQVEKEPPWYGNSQDGNVRPQMEAYIRAFTFPENSKPAQEAKELLEMIERLKNPNKPTDYFFVNNDFRAKLDTFRYNVRAYTISGKWPND